MGNQVELNETELLMLQQQMRGNVSGLGYTLKSAGVNRADFTGNQQEDIHQHGAIREADVTGEIYKIKFYVDYSGDDTDLDRTVLLTVFGNGHITCQTPVKTELFDRITEEITNIKEYKEYLSPFNQNVQRIIDGEFRGRRTRQKERFRSNVNEAFIELIEDHFQTKDMSNGEKRLYRSIFANIGIKIADGGVPSAASFSSVVTGTNLYSDDYFKNFFTWYAQYEQDNTTLDMQSLSDHVYHLIAQRQSQWNAPIELIEYAESKYGI